ncbi:MAG: carboxypeptidase-like regulatory domain-containing protein, partial [Candidatus Eremiobacteraeota bacterium]|nr:carboxypeptidase-like regulatory domain-containing protein [Candidatus Eremiobacteraeota bacterium]
MSLSRAGKRTGIGLKTIYAFLVALLFIVQATPSALAGTTGILAGTVTAAQSNAPLANVKVTAVALTGKYSATTNSSGFYSMAGVFSDTYT